MVLSLKFCKEKVCFQTGLISGGSTLGQIE